MKKYILTILPMIMVSFSSFGTLNFNASEERPGTCHTGILGVSEDNSTSDMDADFRPNVITINWANTQGGAAVGSGTKKTTNQYDAEIEKPTQGILLKTGYKFVGWKVSGVKTCADFSSDENLCKEHQNCIWKDNTCISNPCITKWLPDTLDDPITYQYGEYDYELGVCASEMLEN
nr:hypothetical protein [Candidatus Enterousia merdequi]